MNPPPDRNWISVWVEDRRRTTWSPLTSDFMWYKIDSLYDCYLLRRLKSTENNIPRFVHSGVWCFFFGIFCPKIKVCDFFSYTWTDAHYIVQFSGKPCLGSNISRNIIPNHVKFGRDRGKHVFYLWGCSDVNKECQFFSFWGPQNGEKCKNSKCEWYWGLIDPTLIGTHDTLKVIVCA